MVEEFYLMFFKEQENVTIPIVWVKPVKMSGADRSVLVSRVTPKFPHTVTPDQGITHFVGWWSESVGYLVPHLICSTTHTTCSITSITKLSGPLCPILHTTPHTGLSQGQDLVTHCQPTLLPSSVSVLYLDPTAQWTAFPSRQWDLSANIRTHEETDQLTWCNAHVRAPVNKTYTNSCTFWYRSAPECQEKEMSRTTRYLWLVTYREVQQDGLFGLCRGTWPQLDWWWWWCRFNNMNMKINQVVTMKVL